MVSQKLKAINNGIAMLHKQLAFVDKNDHKTMRSLLRRIYNLAIERKGLHGKTA
jgi:CII-binding regulator of phage lambda lysogenization HflD